MTPERKDLLVQAITYLEMARRQPYSEHRREWVQAARDIFRTLDASLNFTPDAPIKVRRRSRAVR